MEYIQDQLEAINFVSSTICCYPKLSCCIKVAGPLESAAVINANFVLSELKVQCLSFWDHTC